LDAGARVLGASSMGALRASELDVYGMEGVGLIYQAYKKGMLVSDDEVALTFDPFTFEPHSEPLVNIRFNLEQAWQKGAIGTVGKDRLLRCAQALYFPERSYEMMMERARDFGGRGGDREVSRIPGLQPARLQDGGRHPGPGEGKGDSY